MATTQAEVVVGIISKNRASILPLAIKSAGAQEGAVIAICVFDDNSTDNTKTLVAEFPNVRWVLSKENKGYVYGRNKIMQESNNLFYCSLDDDSWFLGNNEIKTALDQFSLDPKIAVIAFDILSPDFPHPRPIDEPIETNMFIGCGHVLRLSAVKEVGYYDPNPGYYGGEEKDLCIRLMDKGYKIVKLPGVHVWHDKTNIARDVNRQHRSGVCNDLVFAFRRIPGVKMWLFLLLKTISHIKFSIFYKKAILLRPCFQGLADFYLLLFRNKIRRKPVSNKVYKKFMSY